MLLILIIILVLLWAAVIWSIYSNFLVFHSNFSESENYHKAYYASISALERWELVVKQRQPWYQWSGWIIKWIWTWSFDWSDKSLSWFSYLRDHQDESAVFRSINSLTNRIPAKWKWDVERMLATWDSKDYNMMDYEHTETILLYYDSSNNNPYTEWSIIQRSNAISWYIRLPGLLFPKFWFLDTGSTSIAEKGRLPGDDSIVDRQIKWSRTVAPFSTYPFTLFSTQSLNINDATVKYNEDTVIREYDINQMTNYPTSHIYFWKNTRNIFSYRWNSATPTIVSEYEDEIKNDPQKMNFLFNGKNKQLKLSLLNLLWSWQNVYPFLEYYFDFWAVKLPDKYFTINGQWNYKDYQVNTIIQKPTIKESVLWNFTSIF